MVLRWLTMTTLISAGKCWSNRVYASRPPTCCWHSFAGRFRFKLVGIYTRGSRIDPGSIRRVVNVILELQSFSRCSSTGFPRPLPLHLAHTVRPELPSTEACHHHTTFLARYLSLNSPQPDAPCGHQSGGYILLHPGKLHAARFHSSLHWLPDRTFCQPV